MGFRPYKFDWSGKFSVDWAEKEAATDMIRSSLTSACNLYKKFQAKPTDTEETKRIGALW